MFKVLIISIGLVLVIEGLLYFILADKLQQLISTLKNYNVHKIKTFSLIAAITGLCLIYFTIRFYGKIE